MSYILKALRKAEQERRAAPAASAEDFLNHPQPGPAAVPARGKNLAILILSALLVLCGGYLVFSPAPGEPPAPSAQPTAEAAPPVVVAEPTLPAKAQAASPLPSPPVPTVTPAPPPVPQAEPTPPAPEPAVAAPVPAPLPPINITGYIYFEDNPERSKLFVDGIVHRLGSRLPGGQIIAGFAEDEVILSWQGGEQRLRVR